MMVCKYYLSDTCDANDCGRCTKSPAYRKGKYDGLLLAKNNMKFFDYRGVTLETMENISDAFIERLDGIIKGLDGGY